MTSTKQGTNGGTLVIERRYTSGLKTPEGYTDPLDSVEYESRSTHIKGSDGKTVFQMEDIEVPKSWSQHATDIAASKYFRKAGIPGATGAETSVKQLVGRVANAVTSSGVRQGYFTEKDAPAYRDELAWLLVNQMAAFNSPVWFNCGLFEAYGLVGEPAGNWCHDPKVPDGLRLAEDSYTKPQVSACFIQKIEDDLMDIAEHVKREARIFKYGSGAGANFSTLRGKGEPLSNGGTSSGMMSFLKVFDAAAGAIKSGGTTRRAAKMVVVDCDHPDVMEFIGWKVREEEKAKALIAAGYSSDFNGEAYATVSGQNANNSISVTDIFMERAIGLRDSKYSLTRRTDGKPHREADAVDVLNHISDAAWECADPGLHYRDTINKWHTCKSSGPINASNPCSEYLFLDESACNLASLNLVKFSGDDGSFDYDGFVHACRVVFLAQEILVDHASYPTKAIAKNSHEYRPLGLGYSNLGALLMRDGLAYDSQAARNYAGGLTSLMTATAYELSAEVAKVRGPFRGFAHNRESMLQVIEMHRKAARDLVAPGADQFTTSDRLSTMHTDAWDRALKKGEAYGYRNAQATLLAPTGTISFLMDCDTTGIEPDYALVKFKKLAGGGDMFIVNQSVEVTLDRLGYDPGQCKGILDYLSTHHKMEGAPGLKDKHLAVFDCATKCGDGARFIKPDGHVAMMEATQPFLSGAISKTINMPAETTAEDIRDLYVRAWKGGVKCLAIYRDNSKGCQVLTGKAEETSAVELAPQARRRLPKRRGGFTQEARIGGQKVYLRTGEWKDGRLGELFIDMHKEGATMRSMTNCFAIAISIGLQYGVPLQEFVEAFTFTSFAPNGSVQDHPNVKYASSIIDYVFRVLAFEYLGRTDVLQIKPEELEGTALVEATQMLDAVREDVAKVVKANSYGDSRMCGSCGHLAYRRGGTCYACDNCGTQTGCA